MHYILRCCILTYRAHFIYYVQGVPQSLPSFGSLRQLCSITNRAVTSDHHIQKKHFLYIILFSIWHMFLSHYFCFFSLTHLHFWSMLFCVAVDYCRLCTPDTHPRPPATGGDFRCGAYLQQMTSFPSLRLQVRHTYSMGLVINIQYWYRKYVSVLRNYHSLSIKSPE